MQSIKRYRYALILGAILGTLLLLAVSKVAEVDYLYTRDPWNHLYLTEHGESQHLYSNTIALNDDMFTIRYPTLMRTGIYLIGRITTVDYLQLYKYGGFLARGLLVLLLIWMSSTIVSTQSRRSLFLVPPLLFTHGYLLTRMWITFPENFAVIAQLSLVICGYRFLQAESMKWFWASCLSFMLALYFHIPSFAIPIGSMAMIVALYVLLPIDAKRMGHKVVTIMLPLLLTALALIPIIQILSLEVYRKLVNNVGNSSFAASVSESTRYAGPDIGDYLKYSSILFFIFFGLGIWSVWRGRLFKKKSYILILFYFSLTFFISLGTHVGLALPTDRMQGFLLPALAIIALLGINAAVSALSKRAYLIVFSVMLFMAIHSILKSTPWFALSNGELEIASYFQRTALYDKIVFFDEGVDFLKLRFPYPENISSTSQAANYLITQKQQYELTLCYQAGIYHVYAAQAQACPDSVPLL